MASSARLDELKKKFDENPRRYFAPLANEHRKSGDLDQAISLCRTHLPLQPGHISGHIVLAQALFEAGSLDESREIFHTALGLDPENLIALRYLGDIAKESHDIETARSWYQRVLEVDPRNDEIEQLVRDLDAPPPAAVETSVDEPPSIESFAPADAAPSAPPPSPVQENDARFAPLSLETMDIDDSFGVPPAEPNETPAAAEQAASAADQSWGASQPGAEAQLLDASGIDPFDLDPSGGADALVEPQSESSNDDFFLTELSGAHATADGVEPEASYTADSWTPQATTAEASTAPADAELDESSFYLEPPPAEPAPASEYDATPTASTEQTPVSGVQAEQPSIPGFDSFAAEYSTGSYEAIPEPEPNEPAMESLAEQPTAEWHAELPEVVAPSAPSAPDDDLGLEVMEFVPPARDEHTPAAHLPEAGGDPLMGHMLPATTNEQSATPAAFVTETMAELYLQQGFRNEALAVYRELLSRNPADENLRDRIQQIESGSISSIGMASVSGDVVESALKRQAGRPARSVRSFFASLAGRRAPAPRDDAALAPGEVPYEPAVEESQPEPAGASAAEYATPVAPIAEAEPVVEAIVEPVVEQATPARPDRITPLMSAAETLASFDPFADAAEAEPTRISAFDTDAIPNEPLAEFSNGIVSPSARQTPLSSPAHAALPEPAAPSEPPTRRSLEDLFPDTPVASRTESAAETLATAFGRGEPQGRPTRAASNELSLDHVFRGAPEGAPPADGGFSFDQFFSDSRAAGADAAPAASAPESGRGSASSDAHDIEQFTAWLEGLKKK
jgi:tetratricopeptide (TPR) repeat protein